MGKKIIQLTESQLNNVIKNTISKVLKENENPVEELNQEIDESSLGELQPVIDWLAQASPAQIATFLGTAAGGLAGFGYAVKKAYQNATEGNGNSGFNGH